MSRHVLVVGSSLLDAFKSAHPACRVSSICRGTRRSTTSAAGFEVCLPEGEPLDAWVDAARQISEWQALDYAIAFGENEQVVAATIASELGVPSSNTVDVVRRVMHKVDMRRWLAGSVAGNVRSSDVSCVADVQEFLRFVGSPCIVKPAAGSGSRGVSAVRWAGDCAAAFSRAEQVAAPLGVAPGVIVEEFVPGRQLSVECISEAARHVVVAITQKYTDARTFAEVGHCVPAALRPEERDAIADFVRTTLDLLGVRRGPTHTEVVRNSSGEVHLLETHTRLGGHGIPALVKAALGVDLTALSLGQVAGVDLDESVATGRSDATAEAVWFGYAPVDGRLHGVELASAPDASVRALILPGEVVTGDMTRHGRVLEARASGRSQDDAVGKASRAIAESSLTVACAFRSEVMAW